MQDQHEVPSLDQAFDPVFFKQIQEQAAQMAKLHSRLEGAVPIEIGPAVRIPLAYLDEHGQVWPCPEAGTPPNILLNSYLYTPDEVRAALQEAEQLVLLPPGVTRPMYAPATTPKQTMQALGLAAVDEVPTPQVGDRERMLAVFARA